MLDSGHVAPGARTREDRSLEISNAGHDHWMHAAIEVARANPRAPFGAIVVDAARGEIIARGVNAAQTDPTAHGEVVALRDLWAGGLPSRPERLLLYSTAEPCPMCQGALLWARLGGIVYGTSIPTLVRLGWDQMDLRAAELAARTDFVRPMLVGGVLEAECDALFAAAGR